MLLEAILQNGLPLDINIANISGGDVAATLHSAMHDFLAQQLQVRLLKIFHYVRL